MTSVLTSVEVLSGKIPAGMDTLFSGLLKRLTRVSMDTKISAFSAGILFLEWGPWLSEKTCKALAVDYARKFAEREKIDLKLYGPPTTRSGGDHRIFEVTWAAKTGGGQPLAIVCDAKEADISVINSPSFPRSGH